MVGGGRFQGHAQELAEGGGCGKSQTALLLKIFLGTGQPQGLLYLFTGRLSLKPSQSTAMTFKLI